VIQIGVRQQIAKLISFGFIIITTPPDLVNSQRAILKFSGHQLFVAWQPRDEQTSRHLAVQSAGLLPRLSTR